jgi:hypothetical protein
MRNYLVIATLLSLAACAAPLPPQRPLAADAGNGEIYAWCNLEGRRMCPRSTIYCDAYASSYAKKCLLDHGAQPVVVVN